MRRALACCLLLFLTLAALPASITPLPRAGEASSKCVPTTTRICRLVVRITTSKVRGAGTDNAVYFDIGPLSWRLTNPKHNDFERGHVDEFDLRPPDNVRLSPDDILWLRLHKKGLFGFTGTTDGLNGAWRPEQIALVVDGVAKQPVTIEEPLNSSCWFWRQAMAMDVQQSYSNATNFARTLRMKPNGELKPFSRFIGFATTSLGKKMGVSGWLSCPDSRECLKGTRRNTCAESPKSVCVTGSVCASATSTDGLASIDLAVSKIEFCREVHGCADPAAATKNLGHALQGQARLDTGDWRRSRNEQASASIHWKQSWRRNA